MKEKRFFSKALALVMIFTLLVCPIIASAEGQDFHIVKEGDVLWKIAESFGVEWQELAEFNGLKSPSLIYPGQKLLKPSKEAVAESVPMVEIEKPAVKEEVKEEAKEEVKEVAPVAEVEKPEVASNIKKIDILTTNDFHGKLEGGYEAGAAKLAAYMNHYKAMNPEGTLILDAGDSFQGTPMSNLLRGKPVVEMMNMIGYDATTIGNHEFDWGIDTAYKSFENAKYKVLVSNIYKDGKLVDWANPYAIFEKAGLKIGVIAFSTPDTATTAHLDFVGDYTFEDPVKVANELIPKVKEEGADIVVLLGHIPARQDKETKEITGELADLANGVTGADAAVGGHSHQIVTGVVNEIPVVMGYKHGRMIGHITLEYDTDAKKVVANNVEVIEVRKGTLEVEPVAEVQAMVDKYNEDLKPIFSEVLGKATEDIMRNYDKTSAMGNWFTDVMKKKVEVQIAFTNAGGMREDIKAGDVTVGNIFEVMPFDNTIVTGEMTGAQIKALLEQSVTLKKGMLQISGLSFTYDSSKPEYERVVDITLEDGTAIDMEATYKVATNDFLAGGQDEYVTLKEVKWTNNYELLRDALKEDIKTKGELAPITEERAKDISAEVSFNVFEYKLAA